MIRGNFWQQILFVQKNGNFNNIIITETITISVSCFRAQMMKVEREREAFASTVNATFLHVYCFSECTLSPFLLGFVRKSKWSIRISDNNTNFNYNIYLKKLRERSRETKNGFEILERRASSKWIVHSLLITRDAHINL